MDKESVLPSNLGGGPHGLGDPDDTSLRKVEIEVMIPKKMRDIARVDKCSQIVKDFSDCCKENQIFMVFSCRKQNRELKDCLTYWYNDENFKKYCREEYLKERSEYRRTGITSKRKERVGNMM